MKGFWDIDEEALKVSYFDKTMRVIIKVRNGNSDLNEFQFVVGRGDLFTDADKLIGWMVYAFPVFALIFGALSLLEDYSSQRLFGHLLVICSAQVMTIFFYRLSRSTQKDRECIFKELLAMEKESPDREVIQRVFSLIEEYCPKGTMEKIRSLA